MDGRKWKAVVRPGRHARPVDAPDAAQGDGDEEDGDIQDNWIDYGSSEQELLVAVDVQGIDEKKLEQAIIERTTVYVDRHIFLHRWCAKSPIADSLQVQDLPFITQTKACILQPCRLYTRGT